MEFDNQVCKRLSFEATVSDLSVRRFVRNGVYHVECSVLMKQIYERFSRSYFRDHCHIIVSQGDYNCLEKMVGKQCTFSAEVYRYERLIEKTDCAYRRSQLGLKKLRKLKAR